MFLQGDLALHTLFLYSGYVTGYVSTLERKYFFNLFIIFKIYPTHMIEIRIYLEARISVMNNC